MKIKIIGKFIKKFDFDIKAEIEIDINNLYKILKEYGYEILDFNDSRRIKKRGIGK